MKFTEIQSQLLQEGGEVFKDAQGNPRTQRIALRDIPATITWLEKVTQLPLKDHVLGSVGKKQSSGDIDVAVDQNQISKDELVSRLSAWAQSHNADPKDYVRKSGISVHFLTPIAGDVSKGYVQTDLMFTSDPQWMKFGMYSAGDASKYTGAERNLLMSSLAKAQGLKYSWQKGLIRRDDESLISKDPDQIAQKLLGKQYDHTVFDSVEQMQEAIHKNPKLLAAFKQVMIDLARTQDSHGNPRKPGDVRKNQEEIARIRKLLDI